MTVLGTDVVAVACILGGAAVGGVVSLAALDGGEHQHEVSCAVDAAAAPRVVVSMDGDEKSIVVAPRVRVHAEHHGCEAVVVDEHVQIRMGEARVEMERAQERVERARVRLQRVDRVELERARRVFEERMSELEGLNIEIEGFDSAFEGLGEQLEAEIEQRLQVEMQELEKRLERLDDEIGR